MADAVIIIPFPDTEVFGFGMLVQSVCQSYGKLTHSAGNFPTVGWYHVTGITEMDGLKDALQDIVTRYVLPHFHIVTGQTEKIAGW